MEIQLRISLVGLEDQVDLANRSSPWSAFANGLKLAGFEVSKASGTDPQALICVNHQKGAIRRANALRMDPSLRVLIGMEPRVVRPDHFRPRTLRQYGLVLVPSAMWAERTGGESFQWPQNMTWLPDQRQLRVQSAIMVQSNKMSAVRGQMYSLRRAAAYHDSRIVMCGVGWPTSKSKDLVVAAKAIRHAVHYRELPAVSRLTRDLTSQPLSQVGAVHDKIAWMSRYQAALVIENSLDYVSEKVFDAFAAGCSVVYVGPDLAQFGVPPALCLQAEANPRSISVALDEAMEESVRRSQVLARARAYEELVRVHDNHHVLGLLAGRIVQHFRGIGLNGSIAS